MRDKTINRAKKKTTKLYSFGWRPNAGYSHCDTARRTHATDELRPRVRSPSWDDQNIGFLIENDKEEINCVENPSRATYGNSNRVVSRVTARGGLHNRATFTESAVRVGLTPPLPSRVRVMAPNCGTDSRRSGGKAPALGSPRTFRTH